jgi:DNA-binding response OmpR family regulator
MKRILITEDDRLVANLCRQQFEEAGYQVAVAPDGFAAIEELVRHPPDLVLLDLMLPEFDGLGVLRFLRSREMLRKLPVLVVSNSSYFSGVVQAALQAGATHFLNKGECSPIMLVDEVRKMLEPHLPSTAAVAKPVEPPPLPPRAPAKVASGPVRVLIADDDPLIHGVLKFFMNEAGFLVRSAFNGRQAIEMAEAEAPDLLVLDVMMPELDGLGVLKQWQQHPGLAPIPVLMLTSDKDMDKKAKALGSGAVEYLMKPFSPEGLVARVKHFVGRRAGAAL